MKRNLQEEVTARPARAGAYGAVGSGDMTKSGNNLREPLFDVHPVTGASIEVFYADGLATFGGRGAGWFWHFRLRGFAPDGTAHGPFPSRYAA